MTKLEKIKQWAKDNGYKVKASRSTISPTPLGIDVELEKTYYIHDKITAMQCITYQIDEKCSCVSYIVSLRTFNEKQELENLFVPLNCVKRDEKLLREYLKNEKNLN